MNGILIAKGDFTEIAKLVRWRSVEIVYGPLKGDNAEYFHNGNVMYLGFQTAGSAFRRSIVVHESVHAILDKRGNPQTVLLAEAAAYIAQCLYYYKATGRYIHEVSYQPTADVLSRAGDIAVDIQMGKGITDPALKLLYEAIPKVPTYNQPYAIYAYNGI